MCVFKYHAFIFYIRPPRWRCKTLSNYPNFAKYMLGCFNHLQKLCHLFSIRRQSTSSDFLIIDLLQWAYTVCCRKKAPQLKNCRFLKYLFTGIIYSIQWKKWPKPFPRELVLRRNFYFGFTITVLIYFL
jgi:hypothetical protein